MRDGGGVTPLVLNLGALPLYRGEISPNYSWDWNVDRNQNRFCRFCRSEKVPCTGGNRTSIPRSPGLYLSHCITTQSLLIIWMVV